MEGRFCTSCGAGADPAAPQPAAAVQTPPAAPAAPKKSNVLIWVLAGCGGLIAISLVVFALLGFFVSRKASEFGKNPGFAAAKMMASMNPDVEVVEADEDTGKITLREKKSGKTVTMNFQDIQKGRLSFEGADGEKVDIQGDGEGSMTFKSAEGSLQIGQGSMDKVPGWVPRYPGGQLMGALTARKDGEDSGGFQVKCGGSVEQVAAYYEKELSGAGMTVQKHALNSGSGNAITVVGSNESNRRTVTAIVSSDDGGALAHVTYQTR
jgi:uncharacterized protein YneF (UPF0154 family)